MQSDKGKLVISAIAQTADVLLPDPNQVDKWVSVFCANWDAFFGTRRQVTSEFIASTVGDTIVKTGRTLDDLRKDDVFVASVIYGVEIAFKTHEKEKLEILRQALVSSAYYSKTPQRDRITQYLRLVDELSVAHVRLLNALATNSERLKFERELRGVYSLLEAKAIARDRMEFRVFMNDLENRFLVRLNDVAEFDEYAHGRYATIVSAESEANPRSLEVTQFGRNFLIFVVHHPSDSGN